MRVKFFLALINFFGLHSYNQLHVSKVQNAPASQKNIIANGADFRGLGTIFKGKNFSNAHLSGATFAKNGQDVIPAAGTVKVPNQASDLSGCNFSNALLNSTTFVGANLEGADFSGADVIWADFSECNLKNAKGFDTAKNVDKAKFCKAILPDGTVLTGKSGAVKSFNPYCPK